MNRVLRANQLLRVGNKQQQQRLFSGGHHDQAHHVEIMNQWRKYT